MGIDSVPRLHWTQRIALVRHNLQSARRTDDFTFFKTLQAHAIIDGTDHVAILNSLLGDSADSVLSTLDNLNAGIAYVHQDAFKAVYDGVKSTMYKVNNSPSSRRSLLRVDFFQQRDMADHSIDKTTNSAINLIQAQPVHCQDAVANAWVTGATIISDAVCVCLKEMDSIEDSIDDFIRLEYSWNTIQNSVDCAISALRGIFTLMATSNPTYPPGNAARTLSVCSGNSEGGASSGTGTRSRQSSIASGFGMIKRAFASNAMLPPAAPKPLRGGYLSAPPDANSRGLRMSMSAACPTRIPNHQDHPHTMLSTIPPTPSVHEVPTQNTISPFKEKNNYFTFSSMDKEVQNADSGESAEQSAMRIESLDPLYSPSTAMNSAIGIPAPLTMRRLSDAFGMSPTTIAT